MTSTGIGEETDCDPHHRRGKGGVRRGCTVTPPKQEHAMNTKFLRDSRELTADELNYVSGGRGHFSGGKHLESHDKLGNFEIQNLMSSFNQIATLASSVLKKTDDTASAIIGKI
jgi:hypothetical protein